MNKVEIDGRLVKGYFASFNTIDSHGDMFIKGAFAESIDKWGVNGKDVRRIKHLAFHDQTKIVSDLITLSEDDNGVFFEANILETNLGNDSLVLYKTFPDLEHSVGYRNVLGGWKTMSLTDAEVLALDNGKNDLRFVKAYNEYTQISNVDLYEGSYVAFGSNRFTPNLTNTNKSFESLNQLKEKIIEQIDLWTKATMDTKFIEFPEFELIKLKEYLQQLDMYEPKEEPIEEKTQNKKTTIFEPLNFI